MAYLNVERLSRLAVGVASQIAVTRDEPPSGPVCVGSSPRGIGWTGVQVQPVPACRPVVERVAIVVQRVLSEP